MIVFWGKVREGKQRGKSLGFPTANISLRENIPEGIYISKTQIHNSSNAAWYPSVTFIGVAKTFGEKEARAETYLLDFDGDLYDKTLAITLLRKIRDNQKFDSVEELMKQMKKDIKQTEKYFKNIANTIQR